ncbi:MAG TPA: hypothetical protein PKU70_07955 [Vicinamibacteria bacterium]|nr:hypothetical protein [Vicinamibacteria bacterium]
MNQNRVARCVSCRSEVSVPDSYADGAQISCGSCAVQLRIVRSGGGLSLVIADPLALRETLRQVKLDIAQANRELQEARASWGIGVNGFGIGVLYVVARVALDERPLNRGLIIEAVVLSVIVGVVLELVNTLFLAKRQTISRLTEQIARAVSEQKELERKIRESSRR